MTNDDISALFRRAGLREFGTADEVQAARADEVLSRFLRDQERKARLARRPRGLRALVVWIAGLFRREPARRIRRGIIGRLQE